MVGWLEELGGVATSHKPICPDGAMEKAQKADAHASEYWQTPALADRVHPKIAQFAAVIFRPARGPPKCLANGVYPPRNFLPPFTSPMWKMPVKWD